MPPRKARKPTEHLHMEFSGKKPLVFMQTSGPAEHIDHVQKSAEHATRECTKIFPGSSLKVIRTSGRTIGSMSHITQEQWDRIFGKKKK